MARKPNYEFERRERARLENAGEAPPVADVEPTSEKT